MLLRHDIDRPARASSASSASGSCASLLTLHALVSAAICGARTNASAQVARYAMQPPLRRPQAQLLLRHMPFEAIVTELSRKLAHRVESNEA